MAMNYSVVRISPMTFLNLLSKIYREYPELVSADFETHRRFFLDHKFAHGDGFTVEMRRRGHRSEELIYNIIRLQTAWAREHGLRTSVETDGLERFLVKVLTAQVQALAPDVLYVQSVHAYPPYLWRAVREACPSVRAVVGHLGYLIQPGQTEGVDFLFVGDPALRDVPGFPDIPWAVIHHAFDASIRDRLTVESPETRHDLTFIGTSGVDNADYDVRYRTLLRLAVRANLRCWLSEHVPVPVAEERRHGARAVVNDILEHLPPDAAAEQIIALTGHGGPLQGLPLTELLPSACHGPLFGLDMLRVIANSRLSFNIHTGAAQGLVGNMRMFEATGLGSCLITDTGNNMRELFEPDAEVVVYRTVHECLEKIRYLLDHDDERRQIAAAGQRRTLLCHTMAQRCEQIDAVIHDLLNRGTGRAG